MKKLGLFLAFGVALTGQAALSPYQENLREIKAIVDSPAVEKLITKYAKLGGNGRLGAVIFLGEVAKPAKYDNELLYEIRSYECSAELVLGLNKAKVDGRPVVGPPTLIVDLPATMECKK